MKVASRDVVSPEGPLVIEITLSCVRASPDGTASFEYTLQDNGTTDGATDFLTDVGLVSFTITEVNDAPAATSDGPRTAIGCCQIRSATCQGIIARSCFAMARSGSVIRAATASS